MEESGEGFKGLWEKEQFRGCWVTAGVNAARFNHIARLKESELDKQSEVAGSLLPAECGIQRTSEGLVLAGQEAPGCSLLQSSTAVAVVSSRELWQNIHRLQTIRQDMEVFLFFKIKISVRSNPFPSLHSDFTVLGRHLHHQITPGAGKTQQRSMYLLSILKCTCRSWQTNRYQGTDVEEWGWKNAAVHYKTKDTGKKKSLRNYPTSAFHKYSDTLVRMNLHQCFLCKCSKQQHKTALKWVRMMSKSCDT